MKMDLKEKQGQEVFKSHLVKQIYLKPVSHTGEWREEDENVEEVGEGGGGGRALLLRGTERLQISCSRLLVVNIFTKYM